MVDRVGKSVLNLGLRTGSSAARFLLLLVLGALWPEELLGTWGVIATVATAGLFLTGMEVYQVVLPTVASGDPQRTREALRKEATVVAFAGFAVFLLVVVLLDRFAVDRSLVWIAALAVVLDGVAQEFFRLLNSIRRPITASVVWFLKSGAWSLVVVGIGVLLGGVELRTVLWVWLGGSAVAAVVGATLTRDVWSGAMRVGLDGRGAAALVLRASPFLVATLSLMLLPQVGRLELARRGHLEAAGQFTVVSAMAAYILLVVDAAVLAIAIPEAVQLQETGRPREAGAATRRMGRQLAWLVPSTVAAAVLGFAAVDRFVWAGRYSVVLGSFVVTAVATGFLALTALPRVHLYLRGRYALIAGAYLGGLLATAALSYAAAPGFGVQGVVGAYAAGVSLSGLLLLVLARSVEGVA